MGDGFIPLTQGGHCSERPKKQEKTGEKTVDLGKKQELAKPINSRKPVVLTKNQEQTVVFQKHGCLGHGLITERHLNLITRTEVFLE